MKFLRFASAGLTTNNFGELYATNIQKRDHRGAYVNMEVYIDPITIDAVVDRDINLCVIHATNQQYLVYGQAEAIIRRIEDALSGEIKYKGEE